MVIGGERGGLDARKGKLGKKINEKKKKREVEAGESGEIGDGDAKKDEEEEDWIIKEEI